MLRTRLRDTGAGDSRRLHIAAGMTPRSIAAAEADYPAPLHASSHGPFGGLFCQIVDRAVKRTHRSTDAALMTHLHDIAPTETYLSAIADDAAHQLYAQ